MEYSRQDRLQRLPGPIAAAGQGDNQRLPYGTGHPPAHHSHRRPHLAIDPHGLRYTFGIPFKNFFDRIHRMIARTEPCPTGGEDELDIFSYPFPDLLLDSCLIIRNDNIMPHLRVDSLQHPDDYPAALILPRSRCRGIRAHEHRTGRRVVKYRSRSLFPPRFSSNLI